MSPLSKFMIKNISTEDNRKIRRIITYTDLSPVQEGKVDDIIHSSSNNYAHHYGWDHYKGEDRDITNFNANPPGSITTSVEFFNKNDEDDGSFMTNAHEWRKKRNFQQRKKYSASNSHGSSWFSSIQSVSQGVRHFSVPQHSRSRMPTLWE